MSNLHGKKVLFIAANFFGYASDIQCEIESRGATVNYLEDRPFSDAWKIALAKLFPSLMQKFSNRYYRNKLKSYGDVHYDLVFVITGESLTQELLKEIRLSSPKAKFVLYIWDSILNKPGILRLLDCYDEKYSFEKTAITNTKIKFRSLFFTSGFENVHATEIKFLASFIGTMHSDRYSVLSQIKKSIPVAANVFFYFYIQAPWVYWIYKLTKPSFMQSTITDFKFKQLDKKTVQRVFFESKVILDIEHPSQSGLTMRTIEALGAKKKLITTNQNVASYDFFNVNNIYIIDRADPVIPEEFFESEYEVPPEKIYNKYRLSYWLDDVLGHF